ncbi:MFS general substrate transporter [Auriscalpium vulgare]|uniref:MFS general substrate transporter n=1 Tax=Auriscalpium vulgare TaxID=40419 RepID=A0ACB8RUR0_9AGAM|nr:MFS general substrate transporter [Auriscalpium vulgare]
MDPHANANIDASAGVGEKAVAFSSNSTTHESLPLGVLQPQIPDGGAQAWMTLIGAYLVVFSASGYINSFGVYEDFYVREYLSSHSSSSISWIGGAQTCCLFSVGIFSGYAMDVGYFRPLMLAGSILFVFCLFMISLCQPQQWYQGLGLGIAIGSIYVPSLGILAHHFKRRRSLAMGIVASASSVGGVIHPIMLNQLIHGHAGFHQGVRISAFFNLALLGVANLLMSTRLPPQGKTFAGQFALWKRFFSDVPYVVAVAGTFLMISGVFFPTFFLQLFSVLHGINKDLSFYTIAVLNASSAFGRVVPTIFADRVGVFKLIVPCTLMCGVIVFAMIGVTDAVGAYMIAIFYGFFSGATISLAGPMFANLSTDVSEIGARIGVAYGISGLGSLLGPPVTGVLLTSRNIWIRPIIFSGVVMCAGAAGLAIAGLLYARVERHRR